MPDLRSTAAELRVSPTTLRRWLRAGAPQARRGRRGRGGAAELDPAAIAAWRASGGESARSLAGQIPDIVAKAVLDSWREVDGPHKAACAGALAGCWYLVTVRLLDHLRDIDHEIPDPSTRPAEIDLLLSHYRRHR